MTQTSLPDPQSSIAVVLKPPPDFESIYQGEAHTTPIPLVAQNLTQEFVSLDDFAGKPGIASNFIRFVPVPLGATLMILIPEPFYSTGGVTTRPAYQYQLRWRLRTFADWSAGAAAGNPSHPWALVPKIGNSALPGATAAEVRRTIIPSYTSEVVTPTAVGSVNRPLVAASTYGTSTQGVYAVPGATKADGDLALGPSRFPPILRPAVGNELSISVAFNDEGIWDFTDPAIDAAFSNLFGTNVAGPTHEYFPGVGVYLVSMSRSTTP